MTTVTVNAPEIFGLAMTAAATESGTWLRDILVERTDEELAELVGALRFLDDALHRERSRRSRFPTLTGPNRPWWYGGGRT